MEHRRFRELLTGPPPDADRIFFTSLWFKGHNNPRYAELLPRLTRLDGYLATASGERIKEGSSTAPSAGAPGAQPHTLCARKPTLPHMFTADNEQIPHFAGAIVSDVDDPFFRSARSRCCSIRI